MRVFHVGVWSSPRYVAEIHCLWGRRKTQEETGLQPMGLGAQQAMGALPLIPELFMFFAGNSH